MSSSLSDSVKDIYRETETPSIFIAVPSSRDWKAEFCTSMIALTSHLTSMFHAGQISGLSIRCQVSSLLPMGREMLLKEAIASGSSHILWIDDDTKFPVEAVEHLISRKKDYVAANICRKQYPLSPTAQDAAGKPIDSTGKTGIEEAQWLGLGMCLMRLECIKNIPAPHFEVMWIAGTEKYLGEDMYLCGKLHEAGVKLYVDHDASQLCYHVGDHSYGYPPLSIKKEQVAA